MAQERLTDRTELASSPADGDLVHIVDVSDTTDNANGTSKKITIANLLANVQQTTGNKFVGDITLVSGYTYSAYQQGSVINGVTYDTYVADSSITLSAADGSNDRFDVIVFESDSTFDVVEGTAAADPIIPTIDTDTQVIVRIIRVTAASSTESGVTNELVYDEDAGVTDEWNATTTANVNEASTEQAANGTKSIKFTSATTSDYVSLVDTSTHDGNLATQIKFKVYLPTSANYRFYVQIGNIIQVVQDGLYGFSSSTTASWQQIIIPASEFAGLAALSAYDTIVITNGRNNTTYFIDQIYVVEGFNTGSSEHPNYTLNLSGNDLQLLKDGDINSVVNLSGAVVSDTGTAITFTENTLYNEATPLTSGALTLSLTGAVKGVLSVVYCDGYFPSISGETYKIVVDNRNTDTLNLLYFYYDGTSIYLSIVSTTQLSAPTLTLTPEDLGMGIDWNTIVNADNYVVERSTDNFATAGTQIYSGSLLTYTDSGLTNGTTYYYRIKAQGAGYDESEWSTVASAIPVEFNYTISLVAAYEMESNFNDYLGNHNATPTGMTYTTGKVGNCGVFDGSTSFGEITDDADFSFTDGAGTDTAFTIAFWMYWDVKTGTQMLFEKRDSASTAEWYIFSNATNLICHLASGGNQNVYIRNQVPVSTFSTATWYRCVVTYDGTEANTGITWYVNGVAQSDSLASSGTYTGMSNTASNVIIGSDYTSSFFFDGRLDEVYFYKGLEWTADQVSDDYTQQNAGTATLP